MLTYGAKDLKKRFSELNHLEDVKLVPLMCVLIQKFLEDVATDWTKYGINGFDEVEDNKKKPFTKVCIAMYGRLALKIITRHTNIYATDGESGGYMSSNLEFDSGSIDKPAGLMHQKLLEFVQRLNLPELKHDAAVLLRTRAKLSHLIKGINDFYLS